MEKAVVLSSGGVDSTTALAMAVKEYGKENVITLTLYYGQKHSKETRVAREISEHYGVRHIEKDISSIFEFSDCSLLSKNKDTEIPKGSYAKQLEKNAGNPISTYVPFRNGLFLSTAASLALSLGASVLYYGAHKDDAALEAYPDCSKAFNDAIDEAIYIGSGKQLRVVAPFIDMNKAEVVKTGVSLSVPYEKTWSCYEGKDEPCKKCGTCIDRRKAFLANGLDLYSIIK